MGNAARPQNQHWIPRFYLRGFATEESLRARRPQVWIFSKHSDGGDPVLANIRKVCARRYLYSPRGSDGQRDWNLETRLAGLESTLAQIWPAASVGFLNLGDTSIRKALSLFLAVTWLRHPDNLELVTRMHADFVSMCADAPCDAHGNPQIVAVVTGEERVIDGADWDQYRQWNDDDHHRFFADQVEREAIHLAKLLLPKRWSVVFSEQPIFITSDKPVAKSHQERERFGFGTPGTIVSFPLSPTRVLLMDDNHHEPANQYYPLHGEDPAALNYVAMRNASSRVISSRPTEDVLFEIVHHADAWDRRHNVR